MINNITETMLIHKDLIPGICIAILTIIIIVVFSKKVNNKFPPGPYGLPIVGYLPFLTTRPYLKFIEISKKYGDIFSINLGSRSLVILNNGDHIREAFLKSEFLGRPPYGVQLQFKPKSPFFTCDISIWQEQRRFMVHSMKDLGLGKSKIEEHIKDEILSFLEAIKSYGENPMDPEEILTPSISNNICALVFGTRYPFDHPNRRLLDENFRSLTNSLRQTFLPQFFPWLRYIPFIKNTDYTKVGLAFKNTIDYFREQIKEHEKTLDPQNIKDFFDSYLIHMKSMKAKDPNTSFNEETLLDSASDIFSAGSDTVRTSLHWAIYIVASYQDVQKKIRKEISEVIGYDRMAVFLDQKSMPYTHAVILEVLRWKTIIPLNIFHYTIDDTEVGGYYIPKNTAVMANFWAAHHNPKHWSNPEKFIPERFIGDDGTSVEKPLNYMPFSVGKRICPGETMAYMEIFLYFVSILQKFQVVFPNGYIPKFKSSVGLTLKPENYKVRFLSLINN